MPSWPMVNVTNTPQVCSCCIALNSTGILTGVNMLGTSGATNSTVAVLGHQW